MIAALRASMLASVTLVSPGVALAQKPPAPKPPAPKQQTTAADEEATIRRLEREWEEALVRNDQPAIDRIVDRSCVFVSSNGELMTKAQADADRANTVLRASTTTQMTVRLLSSTVAVVVGTNTETSQYAGQDTSGQYRWTDVFRKAAGQWRVVSAQSTYVDHPAVQSPVGGPVGSFGALPAADAIDGLPADQVRERLGKPSIEITDARGVTTLIFTTPSGPKKVYVFQGKASSAPPR